MAGKHPPSHSRLPPRYDLGRMDLILAVETNPSYAKPPPIFYLMGMVWFILCCLYLRWQMRRKREKEKAVTKT